MTTYYSSFYPIESADGAKGSAAFLGAITTTIIYLYKRSSVVLSDSDKPNGDVVYTFATADINSSAITNGWSETIPAGSDPLYIVAATATGINPTDTIAANEWSSPTIFAQSGMSTATIFLFKRSNDPTLPAAPSGNTTYTFATGVLSGDLYGWSQTAPDTELGKYLFATTATAISTSSTDTISNTEWASVVVLTVNGENGTDGSDGATGLTAYLTNEAHILPASYDGAVLNYDGASGQFKVYQQNVGDVSSNFSLSTVSNPQGLTVAYSTNSYTITGGLGTLEDSATLTIRATGSGAYNGVSIDKVFTLTKSKAGYDGQDGQDGSSAKLLSITADRQVINYSGTGSLNPTTQTTNFTAYRQNTAATVYWTIKDTLGNALNPSTYLGGTTGSTNTMTAAQFTSAISVNGARGVVVTATITDGITLTDSITLVKVVDGVNGQDGQNGTSGIVINLSNDNVTVTSAADGSNPVLSPATTTVYIYEGVSDVSQFWSVTATPSAGVTGILTGKTYTVTGFTANSGYVDFTATRSGYATQTIRFSLSKAKAGSDGTPATMYEVESAVSAIRKDGAGVYSPTALTVNAYSTTGSSVRASYSGRFIIATSPDGVSYTNRYTSAANEASYSYTLIAGISHVRVRLYAAGGTVSLLDEEIIPVVSDGQDGQDGTDGTDGTSAVSGYLSSEAATVFTYADGTPTNFNGINGFFKIIFGNSDVTAFATGLSATASGCTGTINTADNNPVNGQVKGYYRVTAMTGDTATLTLSGTYNGVTITKTYSLAKAKAGYEIVSTLPTTNLFQGRTVFLTSDNKLYRYTGAAWTTAVPALDISGTLADAQIAALAASKITGQLTNAQIASIDAATKLTGVVPIANIPTIPTTNLSGTIGTTQIADDAITTAKIAANAITATEIAADTITSNQIAANAITSNELAANSVISGKIQAGSITATEIAANTITGSKLVAGTITANEIAANTITAAKIQAGAITANEIAANTITAAKIASDTITGNQIAANTITASELAANSVTADKILAGSVTAGKLAAGEIITASAQIADGIINTAKIGNLQVDSAKIADLTVGTQKITDLAVTTTAYSVLTSDLTTTTDYTVITVASVSFTKTQTNSVIRVEAYVQFDSTDDLRLQITLASSQGTYVYWGKGSLFLPYISGGGRLYVNGAGGTLIMPLTFTAVSTTSPVGTDTYTISFYKNGGANSVTAKAGSYICVKEEKK